MRFDFRAALPEADHRHYRELGNARDAADVVGGVAGCQKTRSSHMAPLVPGGFS